MKNEGKHVIQSQREYSFENAARYLAGLDVEKYPHALLVHGTVRQFYSSCISDLAWVQVDGQTIWDGYETDEISTKTFSQRYEVLSKTKFTLEAMREHVLFYYGNNFGPWPDDTQTARKA